MRISDWSSDVCSSDLVMAGPMFIASTAELVIAQCQAGIIGAMPALNPRSTEALDKDLSRIAASVGSLPWCVNLVAHKSNERLRSEEHTSELQSLMRISYAVFCLNKKNKQKDKRHKSTL